MDSVAAIAILAWVVYFCVVVWKKTRYEPEEECTDFDLMTAREKVENVREISDAIYDLEQMETDLDCCNPRTNVKAITLCWLGEDDENHQYTLFCDGEDTNTEALKRIVRREIHDLRAEFSYKTAVLSECTRSGQNSGQNVRFPKGEVSDNAETL